MADYVVVDKEQLEADLTIVADSIRAKANVTEQLEFPNGMKQAVEAIQSGGSGGSDKQFIYMVERTTNAIVLPNGVTKIGDYAFYHNSILNKINIPNGVTKIGDYAFSDCSNLALISLPDGITNIGTYAFSRCSKLALTSLPDGITNIGTYAFYGCSNLETITFLGKPSSIASNAFGNCTNLLDIYVPWAEGEVANAPWGATNATIHYNHQAS